MTAFLLTSSLTMVLACARRCKATRKLSGCGCWPLWLCGLGFVILHGREWSKLISEGLTLPVFSDDAGSETTGEFAKCSQDRAAIRRNVSSV